MTSHENINVQKQKKIFMIIAKKSDKKKIFVIQEGYQLLFKSRGTDIQNEIKCEHH